MNDLYCLLDQHRVEKGASFSHTSLGFPKGSFFVPSDRSDDFLRAYVQALQSGQQPVHLTERHKEVGPVVVDLDFRHMGTDATRRYTHVHVERVVATYVDCMKKLLSVSFPVRAVVMEKPAPVLSASASSCVVKDGIHVVFPDVVTPPVEQHLLRVDVIKSFQSGALGEDLRPCNPWSEVVDDAVISKNNWMMYGSRKPNAEPYLVTRVLLVHQDGSVARDPDAPSAQDFAYWAPELSIRNKYATTEPLEHRRQDLLAFEESMNIRALQSAANKGAAPRQHALITRYKCSEDYETARKFAAILSPDRADAYSTWVKVGICLHNIDDRLLDCWVEFSKKSPKYKEGECERMWRFNLREDGTLGMGSLGMWARQDNPCAYADINKQRILSLILRSCNGDAVTHYDVAVVVHTMYRHQFACASIRNRLWYEFKDHRWRVSDSAYTLRRMISTEVYSEYVAAGAYFQERASLNARQVDREESQTDSKKCLDTVKRINGAAMKLKTVGFKESLIKELSEMFFHEGFEEKLNSKGHLIGFDNGVYDMDAQTFRDGQPEDFVSFSTGYDFVHFDPHHPTVAEIDDFFEKVFRSPDLRTYVLHTLAASLHGGLRYERYNMWHGAQGANGKSKLLDLIEQTLGDYAVKFPVSLLTQKRVASNAATSELARSKGRRFASMQEPGENETLNIGIMKELSGNDRIVARHLFHEAIEFRPCYKMFMCCNHLPHVPSQDGGTWRRIRVVEFKSRFCENPDPCNPDEFLVDYNIDSKFELWKVHMMGMLLRILPEVRNGIPEPRQVLEYTLKYQRSNDSVSEFLDTFIRSTAPDKSVTVSSLLRIFRQWMKKHNPGGPGMNMAREEFKIILNRYFSGERQSQKKLHEAWFGYRILTEEEEAEEARFLALQAIEGDGNRG